MKRIATYGRRPNLLLALVAGLLSVSLVACGGPEVNEDDNPEALPEPDVGLVELVAPENTDAGDYAWLVDKLDYSTSWEQCVEWGDLAWENGDLDSAAALYEEAFDRGRVEPTLLFRIGWCLQERQPRRAIDFYNLTIDIKTDMWEAWFNRANSYYQMDRIADRTIRVVDLSYGSESEQVEHGALHFYSEMISAQEDAGLDPWALALFNRAHCFYLTGALPQARSDYIRFYESGGRDTPYAANALEWIALLEQKLHILEDNRYRPPNS